VATHPLMPMCVHVIMAERIRRSDRPAGGSPTPTTNRRGRAGAGSRRSRDCARGPGRMPARGSPPRPRVRGGGGCGEPIGAVTTTGRMSAPDR